MNVRALVGDRGSGKTLLMVWFLKQYYDLGYKIYSNLKKLKIPHEHIMMDMFLDTKIKHKLKNAVIGIDEVYTWIDSRTTMVDMDVHLMFGTFVLQIRKLHAELIYTAPQMSLFDVRVRENTDYIYECESWKKIYKDGAAVGKKKMDGTRERSPDWIRVIQTDLTKRDFPHREKIFNVDAGLFSEYDTNEIIDPFEDEVSHTPRITQEERLRNLKKVCAVCHSLKNLDVHHIEEKNDGNRNADENLITLCRWCHVRTRMLENGMSLSLFHKKAIKDWVGKYLNRINDKSHGHYDILVLNKVFLTNKEGI